MAITPVPSSRVSDMFMRQKLLSQLHVDQSSLLRLQTQLSTGQRIQNPSEDAPAALRATALQSLLERKTQVQTNLSVSQSYLGVTDSAVSQVANLMTQARGIALASVGSTGGASAKETAALQIDQILRQMVDIGNQQFRGRYLFAGGDTTQRPFDLLAGSVAYRGDAETIMSYSDIDVLFETNVHGDSMFGAISSAVQAGVDLNPRLTANTRLRDLHGGKGILPGSLTLSNGTVGGVVDISRAETLGDVAALLEGGLPNLRVTISATGLDLELTSPGDLTVKEVSGGTTAHELGIFRELGAGPGPFAGGDLDPRLTKTTSLDDILGVRASARLNLPGNNNDLLFEAAQRGPALNGVTISFVHGGAGTAGSEVAVYDASNPLNKTLTITIESGVTTAQQVIDAVNTQGTFSAQLNLGDEANDGTGVVPSTAVEPLATAATAGGAGIEFDQAAGIQIVNGGQTFTIDLDAAETVEDLLNRLNGAGASVLAEINADGTGINVHSRLNGTDFSIGENGGATATQLGLRSFTAATRLDDLNHGAGVRTIPGDDFQIRRRDGVVMGIDVSSAQTIGDVIAAINADAEQDANPAKRVTARLAQFGNGIELVTSDPAATATFAVLAQGATAEDLGLVPLGTSQSAVAVSSGGTDTLTGRDVRPFEGSGVFHALVRLRDAFRGEDLTEIERSVGLLDASFTDLNFARAELGARMQTLDVLNNRLQDEDVDLRGALSKEIDVDLIQAISDLTARQATFEASLNLTAKTAQLTLLDFL